MKILIVSDLHGQAKTLKYLAEIIKEKRPDALIIPGDITDRDNTAFLDELFLIIKNSKLEAFLIWGNSDEASVQKILNSSTYSSNLVERRLGKYKIYGIPETDEAVIPDGEAISNSILITHRPPAVSALNAKLKNAPFFHINGHIHSRGYLKKYPSTMHLQVPSLQLKKYVIFDPDNSTAQFLSL